MANFSDPPNVTDYTGLISWVNELAEGTIIQSFLMGLWVVIFMGTLFVNKDPKSSFAAASFPTAIIAILFRYASTGAIPLVSNFVIILLVVMTFLSVVWLYFTTDS